MWQSRLSRARLAKVSDPYNVRMTHNGNKLRWLRGDRLDSSLPLWQDDQWWIHWPGKLIYRCSIILRKMHTGIGIG
jgi:hypothetical protein